VGFEITSPGFDIYNTRITSKIGSVKACGYLGANHQTQVTSYYLSFEIFNQVIYTSLPHLKVVVLNETTALKVPDIVDCTKGGQSTPILITIDVKPFTNFKLEIKKQDDEFSKGITIN
jgi:hypothetical protein